MSTIFDKEKIISVLFLLLLSYVFLYIKFLILVNFIIHNCYYLKFFKDHY